MGVPLLIMAPARLRAGTRDCPSQKLPETKSNTVIVYTQGRRPEARHINCRSLHTSESEKTGEHGMGYNIFYIIGVIVVIIVVLSLVGLV